MHGTLAVGETIIETVALTPGTRSLRLQRVVVTAVSPSRVEWASTMLHPYILYAHRVQSLTEQSGGGVLYETSDVMTGLLAPLVLGLYGGAVRRGFEAIAAALKARAEEAHERGVRGK
jgi:hypothetical protein